MLRAKFFTPEQVEAIVRDYRQAGLTPAEVAMMALAEKITLHAYKVTQEDVEELRCHRFSDEEIFDIVLTVAARTFFSKVLDAVGAEPDDAYRSLETDLKRTLTVGRPFRLRGRWWPAPRTLFVASRIFVRLPRGRGGGG